LFLFNKNKWEKIAVLENLKQTLRRRKEAKKKLMKKKK
jgi:hypothetical protein